ncbi:MAG: GNAT family N-acetyltransferase [Bacillaceae bacterium]|nr:GNAT family N-acetyltransferase [Bacillaceae bacterium]
MNCSVRDATYDDIPEIQKIAEVSWHDTYQALIPEEIQNKFLEQAYAQSSLTKRIDQTIFKVAEVDGRMAGFINVIHGHDHAELSAFYMHPDFQRQRIGSRLLEEVLQEVEGISEIYVEVEKGNKSGETFYQSRGFQVVEEYEEDFMGHPLNTLRMVLKIRRR